MIRCKLHSITGCYDSSQGNLGPQGLSGHLGPPGPPGPQGSTGQPGIKGQLVKYKYIFKIFNKIVNLVIMAVSLCDREMLVFQVLKERLDLKESL